MSAEPKYINADELRKLGILQEVNRQFFHRLGLALQCGRCEHDGHTKESCTWPDGYYIGVLDFRDDSEDVFFTINDSSDDAELHRSDYIEKADNVAKLVDERALNRAHAAMDSSISLVDGIQEVLS